MKGRISSIETMGLVDGPGIRFVVFFQGCSLRCEFCHNPDTWDYSMGEDIDSEELLNKILRFRTYFDHSGGGVTFSGGEPLMQKDFLIDILKKCKENNIHTCIDTSGVGMGNYEEILSYTDLVLYDVKAIDAESYMSICKFNIKETEKFQKALLKSGIDTTVRAVIIPGINDNDEYMINLLNYIKSNIPTAKKVELLPYHKMGAHKYTKIGISDPLAQTPQMDRERCEQFWEKYFKNL